MNITNLYILIFLIIILSFIINYRHLLISLLYLEGIILIIVLFISLSVYVAQSSIHQLRLILLTFSACEARLGLRLIVKLSRRFGSDLLSITAINSC